ncbi:methyl-accepting chemotaxis protein [Halosimplex amylolyticum]|uniref:methyl-accepting chemotaxis protein n=1 Tax=Halosimplex amylolyticum TaxID=3396616 RepID=UPI003F56D5F8
MSVHPAEAYKSLIRRSMESIGVDRSVERTVLAAAGIQFLISVGQAVLPFVTSGTTRVAMVAILFGGAALALGNTVWITREAVVVPIQRLEAAADRIAGGEVDVSVAATDDRNEVGSLTRSFAEMQSHIALVAAQADALAAQEFEAAVLDEQVPGAFGDSLSRMAASLHEYTDELETMTTDLERRSDRLEELVVAFADAADRAADGDLTATLDADDFPSADAQYREICENFNRLVETLGAALGDVRGFAGDVSEASGDVAASVDELDRASDEVADSVQEISDGATRQTEQFQSVAEEMNGLSATVEQIAAAADEAAGTAATAAERGRSGRDAAAEAIDALDDLEERIERTAAAVDGLADRIGEIDEIVSFIDEIAEQTNMLALNASIEAARADGAGDGFAVVADEVKSLAEETRDAAEEVGDLVASLQDDSAATASEVRVMRDQVGDSVDTIDGALADFEDIVAVVGDVNESVQEISDATDEGAETTQDVVDRIDDVAAISEQSRDEAESVAAAAEEQTASVSTVSADVRSVADRADDLRAALDRFRLPDATADSGFATLDGTAELESSAAVTDD